jgi:hypothetical protein
MRTQFFRIAGLTMLLGALVAPAAHAAQVHIGVSIGVPAPVVVAPAPVVIAPRPVIVAPPVYVAPRPAYVAPVVVAPVPGYIWQPGYYVTTGYVRHWVPGAWVAPHAHVVHGHAYGHGYGYGYGYYGHR